MIDPITLEVIRETLVSTVREMRVTLVRTAYSSILYEGEDFSCVLMDGDAQIVAMSKGADHPLHIVPISWSMKAVREKFGDDIHPGDMFLHNDPYTGGTHLNDVALIQPLFADGRLFIFPVVRAHWGDVGGMSPGSLSGGATEIFQEGVRIPPIRVIERGRPNDAALDLIFANMRGPRERRGDYHAMIGTCRKAAERVEALAARYGADTVRAAVADLMDRAEGRMRRAIAALPDGEYRYEAHLESGRERLEPLTVRARVAIAGDTITVDLTGTSPQTAGPTNVGPAMAPTGAFTIVKSYLDPGSDVNSGAFRPLTVISPLGTIVNAEPPAPCGGMVEVKYGVETAVQGALAQALDGKVAGRPQGRRQSLLRGRTGSAGYRRDVHLLRVPGRRHRRLRERRRQQHRARVDRERHDHAAADRGHRAALPGARGDDGAARGLRRARTVARGPRAHAGGAHPGAPHAAVGAGRARGASTVRRVRRAARGPPTVSGSAATASPVQPSALPGKVSAFPVQLDDVLLMESSGGGGFGDPLERDPGDGHRGSRRRIRHAGRRGGDLRRGPGQRGGRRAGDRGPAGTAARGAAADPTARGV